MRNLSELVVLMRGGGEAASATAHRLHRAHFRVCLTEVANPLAVSRATAFSEAIFDGQKTIQGVTAELVPATIEEVSRIWRRGNIPIVIDPAANIRGRLKPDVLVESSMLKKNAGTKITDAPLVIALGPGYQAGRDVHVVIETFQNNDLGKVLLEGEALANTGEPVVVGGFSFGRVIWAVEAGLFTTKNNLGDRVEAHQVVAWLNGQPLAAPVNGMLRGLMRDGVKVRKGDKLIEVDPVNEPGVCSVIRDKFRAISGGVLEAIMQKYNVAG
jgi:xanthine dehydrogenase accessory factor